MAKAKKYIESVAEARAEHSFIKSAAKKGQKIPKNLSKHMKRKV